MAKIPNCLQFGDLSCDLIAVRDWLQDAARAFSASSSHSSFSRNVSCRSNNRSISLLLSDDAHFQSGLTCSTVFIGLLVTLRYLLSPAAGRLLASFSAMCLGKLRAPVSRGKLRAQLQPHIPSQNHPRSILGAAASLRTSKSTMEVRKPEINAE